MGIPAKHSLLCKLFLMLQGMYDAEKQLLSLNEQKAILFDGWTKTTDV